MADQYPCVECRKNVAKTASDRYRSHTTGEGTKCELSSEDIPEHILANGPVDPKASADVPVLGVDYAICLECERKVKLTRLGYYENHDKTLRGGDRCINGGVRFRRKVEDVVPDLPEEISAPPTTATPTTAASIPEDAPGRAFEELLKEELGAKEILTINQPPPWIDPMENSELTREPTLSEIGTFLGEEMDRALAVDSSASTEISFPESTTTLTDSTPLVLPSSNPETFSWEGRFSNSDVPPGVYGTKPNRIWQPNLPFGQPPDVPEEAPTVSRISQPPPYEGPVRPQPMSDLAKELATGIKEAFYSYSNRKTTDNRSAQTTLGPSEIGTPCDRRLAMSLLGVSPVNPGGDGWAAFVGTCTHVGMAEVYTFADAGTGRYAVEMPVFLGIPTVPRGTTDLLIRQRPDGAVVDWKVMGEYSLKKFKTEGPSATYRVQAHVYGLGAERGGEKVRNVAIVGLPRAGSSLDEMHVWTEKFDRKFAQAALDRVEKISQEVNRMYGEAAISDAGPTSAMEAARSFDPADDCRYCPFYLKGDTEMKKGCPGK